MTMHSSYISVTDLFCGAGGSSVGASRIAGVEIRQAANHNRLCIDTHNTNFPNTDHYLCDISLANPRRFRRTTLLIASPECTDHSLAKGARRRCQGQLDLWGDDGLKADEERTRVTMWDPLRFAEEHDYEGGVIENVVDVAFYWRLWEKWLECWEALGYCTQVVYLNSMFAHPTPQSRDRLYVVFWKKGARRPNLTITPPAWCAVCGTNVQSIQSWKNGRTKGRYGANKQYLYCCPRCGRVVTPYYYAAANAIDWSLRGERIGDRKRPLAPKTIERITYGLRKFARRPFLAGAYHCTPPWVRELTGPLGTVTTQDHHQMIVPPFVMKVTHGGGTLNRGVSIEDAMPTQTARAEQGLLVPPFMFSNYNGRHATHGVADEPLPTMSTLNNHALVQPVPFLIHPNKRRETDVESVVGVFPTQTSALNHALIVPSGGTWSEAARPVGEALPTQTARESYGVLQGPFVVPLRNNNAPKGTDEALDAICAEGNHHGLVRPPFVLTYRNDDVRELGEALPTVTSIDRHSLVEPGEEIAVEDCYFRMLQAHEIKAAMAFPDDYVILGNQREQVMQAGQAVTPPVMEVLVERLVQALGGGA